MNKFPFFSVCMALLLLVCCLSCTKKGTVVSFQPFHTDTVIYTVEDFETTGFRLIPDRHAFFMVYEMVTKNEVEPRSWQEKEALAFRSIVPDQYYLYWECFSLYDTSSQPTQIRMGTYKNIINKEEFFDGHCISHSPYSLYGIVALTPEYKVRIVDSPKKFRKFIGTIDNLDEALFIAKMKGLFYSPDTIVSGSYKKMGKDYLMNLMYYRFLDSLYSVRCVVKQDGTFIPVDTFAYRPYNSLFVW